MKHGTKLTVVTWNLDHWQGGEERRAEAWQYLTGELAERVGWDVALLQECLPPQDLDHVVWRPVRDGPWGTAVVTRELPLRPLTIEDDSHPGGAVVAEVDLGDRGLVTVVSMYALHEFSKQVDDAVYEMRYVITSLHRLLSDLTPLIDHHGRHRLKRPLVIGGDLNTSTQIGLPDRERHRNALDRFLSLGMTDAWLVSPDSEPAGDCPCPDHPACRHVRTHTHQQSATPWQIDYLFANSVLRVRSCKTMIDDRTWQRSEHAPVVAVMERT